MDVASEIDSSLTISFIKHRLWSWTWWFRHVICASGFFNSLATSLPRTLVIPSATNNNLRIKMHQSQSFNTGRIEINLGDIASRNRSLKIRRYINQSP